MVDDNPSTLVKDISSFVRREYGESISYSAAREKSRQVNSRDREEEFSHMTNFVATLYTTCPGPICDCVFDEVDRFQRIFVCPSPLTETLSHSLGVIELDGTHLKSGFGGILVTASMIDFNMGRLLFAFAIVESESLSSWMWFCDRVRVAIDRSEIEISVVVSDRDKGLKGAVATVFPSAFLLGNKFTATTLQHIPVSARHVRAPLKILAMLSGAQTLTGVGGDLNLDKHYYGIRTAQIQTRHWWIF
jgi:hypothetical protein